MSNYEKMWKSLKNDIKMEILEYQHADNITGLNDYTETQLDTLNGVFQMIEGLEEKYSGLENDSNIEY